MGLQTEKLSHYKPILKELFTEPLVIAETYGNHVGHLRLLTDAKRAVRVAQHMARVALKLNTVEKPCVVCGTPSKVHKSCDEARIFCDKCILLVELD